jgi:hypothetical protein
MKRKIRKFRGGGMDRSNKANQAKSASMGNAGSDNRLASATDYSGLKNRSQSTNDALSAQRKGARGSISPSTRTGNRIAASVMNAIIPFSGTVFKKAIDSKAMGYGKTKKQTVTKPPPNLGGGNGGGNQMIKPIEATKPIDPLLIKPKENFFNFVAYKVGGLSGGVSYGPPPKKGPNSKVPPVKLKKGGKL